MVYIIKRVTAAILLFAFVFTILPAQAMAAAEIPAANRNIRHFEDVSAYKFWSFQLKEPVSPEDAKGAIEVCEADRPDRKLSFDDQIVINEDTLVLTVMYPGAGYEPGLKYRLTLAPSVTALMEGVGEGRYSFDFTISEDPEINRKPAKLAANVAFFSKEEAEAVLEEIKDIIPLSGSSGQLVLKPGYASRKTLALESPAQATSLFQLKAGEVFWIENEAIPLKSMSGKLKKVEDKEDGTRILTFTGAGIEEMFEELEFSSKRQLTKEDLIDQQLPEGATLAFDEPLPAEEGKVGAVAKLPTLRLNVPDFAMADGQIHLSAEITLENPTLISNISYKTFSWRPLGHTVIPKTRYGIDNASVSFTADSKQKVRIKSEYEGGYGLADYLEQENKHSYEGDYFEVFLKGVDFEKRAILGSATFDLDTLAVITEKGPPSEYINLGGCILFTVTAHGELHAEFDFTFTNEVKINAGMQFDRNGFSKTKETGVSVDPETRFLLTGDATIDVGFGVGAGLVLFGVVTAAVMADLYEELYMDGAGYIHKKPSEDVDIKLGRFSLKLSTHFKIDAMVALQVGIETESFHIWWFKIPSKTFSFDVLNKSKTLFDSGEIKPLTYEYEVDSSGVPEGLFVSDFYQNDDFDGIVINSRYEEKIDHLWKAGEDPVRNVNGRDDITARWEGEFPFDNHEYVFAVGYNQGVRVSVNDEVYFSNFPAGGVKSGFNAFDLTLSEGYHKIKVEAVYADVYGDIYNTYTSQNSKIAFFDWAKKEDAFFARYYNGANYNEVKSRIDTDTHRSLARLEAMPGFAVTNKGPHPGVSSVFGAVWEKEEVFEEGTYDFILAGDKYVELLVDGVKVLEGTGNGSTVSYFFTQKHITAGKHDIKIIYAGDGGYSGIKVYYGIPPKNEFAAFYYNNANLTGAPAYIDYLEKIDKVWDPDESPASGVNKDFSAAFFGYFDFKEAEYLFTAKADDNVRVYVDGEKILDRWNSYKAGEVLHTTKAMTEGRHLVRVEFRDTGGDAIIYAHWEETTNKFVAVYSNKHGDSYTPVRVVTEDRINHDWGSGSPYFIIVNSDYFSVDWTGKFTFEEGDYYFNAQADDTLEIKVDGQTVYRQNTSSEQWKSEMAHITAGVHTIQVHFYENEGLAYAKVNWVKADQENVYLAKHYYVSDFNDLANKVKNNVKPNYVAVYDALNQGNISDQDERLAEGFGENRFGVYMSGNFELADGNYVVGAIADDRIDIYLDGVKLLSSTYNNGQGFEFVDKQLVKQAEELKRDPESQKKMTYHVEAYGYNQGGPYAFRMIWLDKADNTFFGKYYNNMAHSGRPIHLDMSESNSLDRDWGAGSPEPSRVGKDFFSSTYEGDFAFDDGYYLFSTRYDDMGTLYVDGKVVQALSQGKDTVVYMTRGIHKITVESTEIMGNAYVKVNWRKADNNTFYAVNYDAGWWPKSTETLPATNSLSKDWGSGHPAGVGNDDFHASYSGVFDFEGGAYKFNVRADDTVDIYIDGVKHSYGLGTHDFTQTLEKGRHIIEIWFTENGGLAYHSLNWSKQ